MKWADDNPELFAMMEKTRMYIFRGERRSVASAGLFSGAVHSPSWPPTHAYQTASCLLPTSILALSGL